MSDNKTPKVYIEASPFISFFQKEAGRWEMVNRIIQDAKLGRIELVTSWATACECPKSNISAGDGTGRDVTQAVFDLRYITKVDLDKRLTEKCRELQRLSAEINALPFPDKKPILKPMDAVHVACALQEKVDYLFTYDEKHIVKYDGHNIVSGLKICFPYRPWCSQTELEF